MTRLTILSSEFSPGPGGIGTHAYQLALNLKKLGWEISVVTSQNYVSEKEIERFNNAQPFEIIRFNTPNQNIKKILKRRQILSSAIRRWRPDLLLASGDRMVYLMAWVVGKKIPWVAVEHGRIPGRFEKILKRWALGRAEAIVCVSEYTKSKMLSMEVKNSITQVIPNGADESLFRMIPESEIEKFRTTFGLEQARIILTVGHISDRKGQDTVIRALPAILRQVPNVHYCMIGLPTEKVHFQQIARALQIETHVHFLGAVDPETLLQGLNACDVFVMTSRHSTDGSFEGYGIAAVEAALCGKPAVISRNSGLSEAVLDGKTGMTVPSDSPEATAEAILSLLQNDSLRIRLGQSAQTRALTEQTWKRRAEKYDSFLRTLLK